MRFRWDKVTAEGPLCARGPAHLGLCSGHEEVTRKPQELEWRTQQGLVSLKSLQDRLLITNAHLQGQGDRQEPGRTCVIVLRSP